MEWTCGWQDYCQASNCYVRIFLPPKGDDLSMIADTARWHEGWWQIATEVTRQRLWVLAHWVIRELHEDEYEYPSGLTRMPLIQSIHQLIHPPTFRICFFMFLQLSLWHLFIQAGTSWYIDGRCFRCCGCLCWLSCIIITDIVLYIFSGILKCPVTFFYCIRYLHCHFKK